MATISTGVEALEKIQIGKESTAGTAVAATTIWRGLGRLQYDNDNKRVAESIGQALPTTREYNSRLGATVAFDPVEATFQQLPYLFEAGVAAESPVQDGAGSDYIYAYSMPKTSMNTLSTYTIEHGNNVQAREMEYSFIESFKISGNAAEGIMMEAAWRGRQSSDTSFTPALGVPAITPSDNIVFGGSTLAIDAVGGTLGATAISNTLLSFELNVTTGYKAKYTNAAKYFDFIYWDRNTFSAILKLTFEHNATSEAQVGLFEANTPRQYRLEFTGGAFGTGGTTYSNHTFRIDCAGTYINNPQFSSNDGNNVWVMDVEIGHDLTANLGLDFLVVNELSSLP